MSNSREETEMSQEETTMPIVEADLTGTPLDNYYESSPLYSEILPGLFLGGTANSDTIFTPTHARKSFDDLSFQTVVTLFYAANPPGFNSHEMRYHIVDGPLDNVDMDRLEEVVNFAYGRFLKGDRVLVRCQAGINRSSFIMSLILIKHGYSALGAIELIRSKRFSYCLSNEYYEKWLFENGEEFIRNLG